MFEEVKIRSKTSEALKHQKPDIWEWLTKGTGSVAEPWPTVAEVLANPEVQKQIQDVQEAFTEYKKSQNRVRFIK